MPNQGQIIFNPTDSSGEPKELVDKAQEEAFQEEVKEDSKNQEKLDNLSQELHKVILKIQTARPLDFFPDQVTIDANKVNIVHRQFFSTEQIHSLMIENLMTVTVETGPIFATLNIVDKSFSEQPFIVKYL